MILHGGHKAGVILYEMKCLRFLALILTVSPAFAGEYVVFSSGLKLRTDRHELSGGVIRLFHYGGVTEVPAKLVSGFEEEEVVTPEHLVAPAAAPPLPPEMVTCRFTETEVFELLLVTLELELLVSTDAFALAPGDTFSTNCAPPPLVSDSCRPAAFDDWNEIVDVPEPDRLL